MDIKKPAILSVSLLTVMTNAAMAPMLGLISKSFPDAGPTLIKQVMTIPSLMIIVFSIISGQLVRVLPKKVILAGGLTVYLAGAFFAAGSDMISELILFRAVMGAGAGLIVPLASSLITDFYSGRERAEMVGYSSFASYTGAASAPLLAGWIASERWQNAFYIYLATVLVLVFTMLFIPYKPAQKTGSKTGQKPIFTSKVLLLALLASFIYFVFYLAPTDVSFLVQKLSNPNTSQSAVLLAMEVLTAAGAGVLFSHFTRKLNTRAFPLGFGALAIGFAVLFLANSYPLLILGMVITGLGIGTLRPLVIYRTSQVSEPDSMTSSFALVNSGFSLGQFLSPFFYFGVSQLIQTDLVSANYLSAAVILALAALSSFIFMTMRRTRTP